MRKFASTGETMDKTVAGALIGGLVGLCVFVVVAYGYLEPFVYYETGMPEFMRPVAYSLLAFLSVGFCAVIGGVAGAVEALKKKDVKKP